MTIGIVEACAANKSERRAREPGESRHWLAAAVRPKLSQCWCKPAHEPKDPGTITSVGQDPNMRPQYFQRVGQVTKVRQSLETKMMSTPTLANDLQMRTRLLRKLATMCRLCEAQHLQSRIIDINDLKSPHDLDSRFALSDAIKKPFGDNAGELGHAKLFAGSQEPGT